jgi:hypothetical protein
MYGLNDDEITAIHDGRYENFAPPEASLLRMADAMQGWRTAGRRAACRLNVSKTARLVQLQGVHAVPVFRCWTKVTFGLNPTGRLSL